MEKKEFISVHKVPKDDKRVDRVRKMFYEEFLKSPEFFVQVPGRVNLIGEHVDYCGYGVCPMALEQNIILAVSKEYTSSIKIRNVDSKKYPPQDVSTKGGVVIAEGPPQWFQYLLCGIKGIEEILPPCPTNRHIGMNIVVSGNVPLRAGLSSSSALVSAAALAAAFAHSFFIPKKEMAELCAKSERYIGTQGGGMDQAIAFLATEGCAKLIDFYPLRAVDIKLPEGATFVIAHSLVEKDKASTSDFNCRVVECRLAAQVIAAQNGLAWQKIKKLAEVQKALHVDFRSIIDLVEKKLHDEPYSKNEILDILNIKAEDLDETILTKNTKHLTTFKIKQRALHVFNEAQRVKHFSKACSTLGGEEAFITLGRLMNESHNSLRDLYECSHSQLDELVNLSRKLTYGTRLTGAGWGGCTVSLLSSDKVNDYIKTVKSEFYGKFAKNSDVHLDSLIFSTRPNAGACVYQ